MAGAVRQLRVVLTTADVDAALRLYRDVLGLPEHDAVGSPDGRVAILDAGRATLELTDPAHAAYIDDVELGPAAAQPGLAMVGSVRLAFEVEDVDADTAALGGAGLEQLAEPTATPWGSRNARFVGPEGIQLTLFEPAPPDGSAPEPAPPEPGTP